jgi:hypothetical protein
MIAKDKQLHLALGCFWLALSAGAYWMLQAAGLGPMLAYSTTVYAVMYEASQWYRGDGQPELLDAIYTAAPGWLAWAVLASLPPGILT